MKNLEWLLFALLLGFYGCYSANVLAESSVQLVTQQQLDPRHVELGNKVFKDNCAVCHGNEAQGAVNWTRPGPDGKYPPPPLNGSGHAWHHSRQELMSTILTGSPEGEGNMPAWKGRLSHQEIEAVITWLQSKWPQPIYEAWQDEMGMRED